MLRRLLLGKGAAATAYALRQKPITTISSSRGGGGGGFFSTSLPRSSSDSPLLTDLFRSYGIREEDTNTILRKYPELRASNVESTLRPKLDFLRSANLTGADISEILVANPELLHKSLENTLSSSINFLKTILPSKDALIRLLRRRNHAINRRYESNIEVLKNRGVPGTWIINLLTSRPNAFARSREDFLATVARLEDLGLSPKDGCSYVRALGVMFNKSRSAFLGKVELFKQLGWSEDQVVRVIRKCPMVMALSDDTIRKKTEFLRDRARWGADCLSIYPQLLSLSLEKRIVPRCAVLNILMSRGLLKKSVRSPTWLLCTDKRFFDKYVRMYESGVPDVVDAFRGHIDFHGWDWLKIGDDDDLQGWDLVKIDDDDGLGR